jgi:hypothetical protein
LDCPLLAEHGPAMGMPAIERFQADCKQSACSISLF